MARPHRQALIDKVALGVAAGLSVAASARKAAVPPRTAREWAATPEFKATIRSIRESIFAQTAGKLARLSVKAATRLGKLVDSRDDELALKASVALLDRVAPAMELVDLVQRLAALEQREEASGGRRRTW